MLAFLGNVQRCASVQWFIGEVSVVVFVLGVIVRVLVVVVLLMVELELVGAVDNKAGHYSVSPGRQQQAAAGLGRWAERERERERLHM